MSDKIVINRQMLLDMLSANQWTDEQRDIYSFIDWNLTSIVKIHGALMSGKALGTLAFLIEDAETTFPHEPGYEETGYFNDTDAVLRGLNHIFGLRFTVIEPNELYRLSRDHAIYESYKAYLQTEHWQITRKSALEKALHRCMICNASGRLQVHHRTYERLGNEHPSDLVVLCEPCHKLFHNHRKLASGG